MTSYATCAASSSSPAARLTTPGVAGRYVIEEWARVPVEHDIASEWRYRNPVLDKNTLVIGISQSGETRDTIDAHGAGKGERRPHACHHQHDGRPDHARVDSVLYTRAGLEMGVAASKTFTAQVSLLYLIALKLAQVRGTLPEEEIRALIAEVQLLPEKIAQFLQDADDGVHPIEEIAERHFDKPFFLYLGRNIGLPICLEGALKLKEISYIPTEAYSAGEMKHGPIALLDSETPVVCVATDSHVYDKVVSNIQETRARGGPGDRHRHRRQRGHSAPRRRCHLRPQDERVTCRRFWRFCRCNFSPTVSLACAASTSINRATWPRRSLSSSRPLGHSAAPSPSPGASSAR